MAVDKDDLPYNNVAHVGADYAQNKMKEFEEASRRMQRHHHAHLDVPYGTGARQAWDLYPSENPAAPCLIHVHGGYWQRGSKEIFGCVAVGVLAHGWSAALPGYTLAPSASLSDIMRELHDALDWFDAHKRDYGIAGPVILSGWSAGGAMAAMLADRASIAALIAISGIYDLAPLRKVHHVNDALQFSDEEVANYSALRNAPSRKPTLIAFGTAELPEVVQSSRDYHAHRLAQHVPSEMLAVPDRNHFDVLDELRKPDGVLTKAALTFG